MRKYSLASHKPRMRNMSVQTEPFRHYVGVCSIVGGGIVAHTREQRVVYRARQSSMPRARARSRCPARTGYEHAVDAVVWAGMGKRGCGRTVREFRSHRARHPRSNGTRLRVADPATSGDSDATGAGFAQDRPRFNSTERRPFFSELDRIFRVLLITIRWRTTAQR